MKHSSLFSFWKNIKRLKGGHWVLFIMLMSGTLLLWQQHMDDYKTSVLPSKTPASFDGAVPPFPQIPKWTALTNTEYRGSFDAISDSKMMPMPVYDIKTILTPLNTLGWKTDKDLAIRNARATYVTLWAGNYEGGENGSHAGIDIKALKGTPVHAIANGIVTKAENDNGGYGNHIVIKHPDAPSFEDPTKKEVIYSGYAHLDQMLVTVGDVVTKGQIIGKSGSTGLSTGPHLHFQIDRANRPWDLYWPFTSAEASAAKLSFFDAVDAGLGRDKVLTYTLSPMLYIQKYQKGTANVDTPKTPEKPPVDTNPTDKPVVAPVDTTPDQLPPVNQPPVDQPPTDQTPDNTPAPQPPVGTPSTPASIATHFVVEHPDTFIRNNPVTFTVKAVDDDNKVVTSYKPVDYIYLQITAGGAQIPPYLQPEDIHNGVITFTATPTSKVGLQIRVTDGAIEGQSKILTSPSVVTNDNPTTDTTAVDTSNKILFTDVLAASPHWNAIDFLKEHKVISGYNDGTFQPKKIVRRDEALKFIFNGTNANLVSVKSLPFKDTSLKDWNAAYIGTAYQRGIISGFEDHTFRAGDTVTRAQFLKMLFKAMKIEVPATVKTAPFTDVAANSWPAPYVLLAKAEKLIDSNAKTFKPDQAMTREEVAEVMYRAILLRINQAPQYSPQLTASGEEVKKYFE